MSEEQKTPEPVPAPDANPATPPVPVTREQVTASLHTVRDPEVGFDVVDLGLIYGIDISEDGSNVKIKMTLTTPYCPYGQQMVGEARTAVGANPGVKSVDIDLVWEPAWDPRTMASDAVKDTLGLW